MPPASNAIICTSIPEGSCIPDQAGSLIVNDQLWGLVSWHLDCDSNINPHCIDILRPINLLVTTGVNNHESSPIDHEIDATVIHPFYDRNTRDFDVALIKLLQPIDLSASNVNSIEIATSSYPFDAGTKGTLVYWELGEGAGLYHTEMPPAKNALICTSIPEGSCIPDQAGSLIVNEELWGLVSWHLDCDSEYKPLVFTNLVFVKHWIDENTRHN
ncbi:trypsin-2-like [Lucilia sericata]|uniref:trypsin-2-like n=1 Tax=Lucilia sericata TaxID=13632 RepID=UPI0018A812F8|nr:trypsin-2-like [Lucilia sericata]